MAAVGFSLSGKSVLDFYLLNHFNKVYRAKAPAKQNPKSEYRNPKQTQRLKSQLRKPKRAGLELSDF
jgi:hypothetical protein